MQSLLRQTNQGQSMLPELNWRKEWRGRRMRSDKKEKHSLEGIQSALNLDRRHCLRQATSTVRVSPLIFQAPHILSLSSEYIPRNTDIILKTSLLCAINANDDICSSPTAPPPRQGPKVTVYSIPRKVSTRNQMIPLGIAPDNDSIHAMRPRRTPSLSART